LDLYKIGTRIRTADVNFVRSCTDGIAEQRAVLIA
jgi:hypothetical protein